MDVTALQSLSSATVTNKISNSNGVQASNNTITTQLTETKDVYTSQLTEIAAKYDVRHMSANEIGDMAQELRDKGLISTPDFLSMSLLPHLIEHGDSGAAAATAADGTVDLIKYWNIKSVKPSDAEAGLKLFDTLISNRSAKYSSDKITATSQNSADIQVAATSYAAAINNSTANAQKIVNVLEAIAQHS